LSKLYALKEMTLRVLPRAECAIIEAAQWCEDREPELGQAFIEQIDTVFQRIEQGPERYRSCLVTCAAHWRVGSPTPYTSHLKTMTSSYLPHCISVAIEKNSG